MYLVDTNILLFSLDHTERLSPRAIDILQAEETLHVSVVSFWEIEIKRNLGKLKIPYNPNELADYFLSQGYAIKDLRVNHIAQLERLPGIHSDPFDRLLIAQAVADNLIILTADKIIPQYPVHCIRN